MARLSIDLACETVLKMGMESIFKGKQPIFLVNNRPKKVIEERLEPRWMLHEPLPSDVQKHLIN